MNPSRIAFIISDIISIVHTAIRHFFDFLFPLSCTRCGSSGSLVCASCKEKLAPAYEAPPEVISFFDYRDEIMQRGIWELKYRGRYAWAEVFGALAYERLLEELADAALFGGFRDPLIVPVPLAPKRLRERGYNQAALIASALALQDESARTFTLAESALIRVRETPKQMEIKNRRDRLTNMIDAFSADPIIVRGKNIIVLDDVSTTGATLRACRDALSAAGARQILLVSIAH